MPELPEVETVMRGLAPVLEGALIERLELRRPDLRFPFPPGLASAVAGRRIVSAGRRAKYGLLHLDDGAAMILHLGMSGRVSAVARGENRALGSFVHNVATDPKHDHVILHLAGGGGFVLNDPRRFGFLDYAPAGGVDAHARLKDLGPEPLSAAFDAAHLLARFEGKAAPLKATLLDQKIVAGLGNIYVCEALHQAKLSPRRAAGSLGPVRAARLVAAVKDVLVRAIAAGGSTLRDFAGVDGALGYFPHDFAVYGREGEACRSCGGVVARIVQSNRSTFFCPHCQR